MDQGIRSGGKPGLIVGIDYSITSPGLCIGEVGSKVSDLHFYGLSGKKKEQGQFQNITIKPYPTWKTDMERFHALAMWAIDNIKAFGIPDLAVIEGYAFGAKGRVFHIAENAGILKYRLWSGGVPILVPGPPEVKKFASGKGNANKDTMWQSFYDQTEFNLRALLSDEGEHVSGLVSDLVDAYWMWKWGEACMA